MADYLILGGGTAGCALASRLKEYDPQASVTLVEAGPDEHSNPLVTNPFEAFGMHESRYEYNYRTLPQKHLNNRVVFNTGGKVLSGSSSVNYGLWARGSASDYDLWAKLVGDDRWGYNGMLPFFRRTETHYNTKNIDLKEHGDSGPMHTTSASLRTYPLRSILRSAYMKGTGLPLIGDANNGKPIGIANFTENWRDGVRQPSGKAYGLHGVEVITNSPTRRILFEGKLATGAELVDGRVLSAKREVIVCCGAIRTPQLLMLSGVGPAEHLRKHGIELLIDAPEIGRNFHDHVALPIAFKIKDIEKGLAWGSPAFTGMNHHLGMPVDTIVIVPAGGDSLKIALIEDGVENLTDQHPHIQSDRGHVEILPAYVPFVKPLTDYSATIDGSCISLSILNILPTSRGSIRLESLDPLAHPLIDPNYLATQADRVVMRHGVRLVMQIVETPEGQTVVDRELPPAGLSPLTSRSSDEEIDALVQRLGQSWLHYGGTASMGKVVDTELKVLGVDRLRVVDASVLPCPIGAHYQVAVYAIAEQAASMITQTWKQK